MSKRKQSVETVARLIQDRLRARAVELYQSLPKLCDQAGTLDGAEQLKDNAEALRAMLLLVKELDDIAACGLEAQ